MGIIELILVGLGLSMDAFAVAVCKGLNMKKINGKHALMIALTFGFFQGFMPFLGFLLGTSFEQYITSIDHWVAFILLGFIGLNMIKESFDKEEVCVACENALDLKELLMMGIATSIDALAVGITFAFLKVNIFQAVLCIGIITFILSLIGVAIGNMFGSRFKNKAEFLGGCILILIGLKILLEHLNILPF